MFCTQQIKTLTPLERSRLISFGIRELAWFLLRIESLHSHYGQISCFIPRVEFKEMENKPLMETIVEEDRKTKQKSNKLKDQPDKEEGIPEILSPKVTQDRQAVSPAKATNLSLPNKLEQNGKNMNLER